MPEDQGKEAARPKSRDTHRAPPLVGDSPADPLRNPVPVAPATDPEYPAVTGPVEMPATVSREGFNPAEVFDEAAGPASTGKRWRGRVPVRERGGGSTLEP